MLQWIYELLMSKQDKQVVVQIMQLWLAKPKAFKLVHIRCNQRGNYDVIKSSEFDIDFCFLDGECRLGELHFQTGWFAKKMLQMFATQQALLCFHENATKKLLAEETPVKEKPLTANEKREQENAYDASVIDGAGVVRPPYTHQEMQFLRGKKISNIISDSAADSYYGDVIPQSVIIKKLYKEKENATPVVLKPPFTEDQIKTISGKKATVKLRNGDVRTGVMYYKDELQYPLHFLGAGYTLKGGFFTQLADDRDIMEIKLEETT